MAKKGSQKSLTTIVVEVGQQDQAKANTNGRNRGKLNPNWAEQLMGLDVGRTQLPTEWTDCDYSATESSRKQQRKHG